jgi:hypothetical protein
MRTATSILVLSTLSVVLANQPIPPQPVDGSIKWIYDLASGQEAARRSGKPLWIVFRCER